MRIDLNSDLGEAYGPWIMGNDELILDSVTSANVACGGHAGDPETMYKTLRLAADRGVTVGAHPGYADREGFGRRVIPMQPAEIGRMVAAQVGALMSSRMARLAIWRRRMRSLLRPLSRRSKRSTRRWRSSRFPAPALRSPHAKQVWLCSRKSLPIAHTCPTVN
jgi:hypothetical protein